MMRINQLLQTARQSFPVSLNASLEAELLLMHTLSCTRTFLYAHSTDTLTLAQLAQFNQLVQQRINGMPIAYLIKQREFWSLPLQVTEATLIPRPETELLVEITLASGNQNSPLSLLELGTGCGAVALALVHTAKNWSILATDNSLAALTIAQQNAQRLQLEQVHFRQSNWFAAIPQQTFDIIVSNPPYLASDDPHLNQGDLRYEPQQALISGAQGMDALQHIIAYSPAYLKSGGYLVLEHGYTQAQSVAELLHKHGFQQIKCFQDLQGHDRITRALLT